MITPPGILTLEKVYDLADDPRYLDVEHSERDPYAALVDRLFNGHLAPEDWPAPPGRAGRSPPAAWPRSRVSIRRRRAIPFQKASTATPSRSSTMSTDSWSVSLGSFPQDRSMTLACPRLVVQRLS